VPATRARAATRRRENSEPIWKARGDAAPRGHPKRLAMLNHSNAASYQAYDIESPPGLTVAMSPTSGISGPISLSMGSVIILHR
jgi:hypothetical protein